MSLEPGDALGPYEIVGRIGSGGMAEVYKARDTRLDRTVAIKILKGEFSERFQREARAISALNHPNICTLYDVGQHNATPYLVMEYVEGRPLEGPLPLREALRLAVQMADALDHAHRRGIYHRDLKPANIMVNKSEAKLLDFGLAKITRTDSAIVEAESTRTIQLTREGMVVGTPAYMPPELWQGQEADPRSDIFSFGMVLYEMLTGRRPFDETAPSALLTAILTIDPPPASSLDPAIPPALDRLVGRCLAKDPDQRWQTAADLREELRWIAAPSTLTATTGLRPVPRRARAGWWVLLAAVAVAVLAVLVLWGQQRKAAQELPLRRFAFAKDQQPANPRISPDGRHIAYQAGPAGRCSIRVQDLDRDEPREVVPLGPHALPFWSPGSDSIGFFAETELKRVSVHGGAAVTVCKLPSEVVGGAAWSGDGRSIAFASGSPVRIYEVPAQGGAPKLLVKPELSEASQNFVDPHFLPGDPGSRLLFFALGGASRLYRIVLQDLTTGKRASLGPGRRPAYSPTGHIVYENRDALWALGFSVASMAANGAPFPVQGNAEYPSVSADGTLAYIGGRGSGPDHLVWKDRSGLKLGSIGQPQDRIFTPMLSPDGSRVAVWGREGDSDDIWIHETERNLKIRVTSDPAWEDRPVWLPDGSTLAFASNRNGNADIFVQAAGGEAEPLLSGEQAQYPEQWSPDGRYLLCDFIGDRRRDIWYLHRAEGKPKYEAVPFVVTEFDEGEPNFSPDGRFVAYSSDESGRREIYIRSFPAGSFKVQVSTSGGSQPRWRGDGRELFYVEGETLMAAPVNPAPGGRLTVGPAQRLFEHSGIARRPGQQYDVSRDGQRFVVIEPTGGPPAPTIRLVQNWFVAFR